MREVKSKKGENIMGKYVTIVGMNHYYGKGIFQVGDILRCKKEPDNPVDAEAIEVLLPILGKIGYIANSAYTVAKGTFSAGRLYDQVKKRFYVQILFICNNQMICEVSDMDNKELEKCLEKQMKRLGNEDDW